MTLFQILGCTLMSLLGLFELYLLMTRQTRPRISLMRLMVWIGGFAIIRWPTATNLLAEYLSIGRGVDVVLYCLGIAFLLMNFYFLHVLEQHRIQITLLVRRLAKDQPYFDPTSK